MAHQDVDRNLLAQRIQGFGNVNPPPLEEETGSVLAKRAAGRLGDMIGEEVMLTVEDFKEKGAVGAVKDAVADAGDILIDGVTGIVGWLRGDPPAEEDNPQSEDATKALSNGPSGAAYGISQASPTGGINAVWVMPEDADPTALAQLATQSGSGGLGAQLNDPRVPKNIQPYQPPSKPGVPAPMPGGSPFVIPGGPAIAPYQPAPAGPAGARGSAPFVPGAFPGAGSAGSFAPGGGARWGQGGYAPGPSGASASGAGAGGGSSLSGAKGLVERIAKGEVIVGADVAKRLVSQSTATKTSAKQLGEIVCERCRRLYLGLDGDDNSDAAMSRLLGLADALFQLNTGFARDCVKEIKDGVSEELLSLRSSAKHKDAAEPMLRRLGFLGGAAAAPTEQADLLGGAGGSGGAAPSPAVVTADLLGGPEPAKPAPKASTDLLGGEPATAPAPAADLLGGAEAAATTRSLDPLLGGPASTGEGGLLGGLTLDGASMAAPSPAPASTPAPAGSMAAGASAANTGARPAAGAGALDSLGGAKKDEDAFGFVGAEILKAKGT